MNRFHLGLYIFFLAFNLIYIVYNIFTGFDFFKILFPLIIALACAWGIRSILKEEKQSK